MFSPSAHMPLRTKQMIKCSNKVAVPNCSHLTANKHRGLYGCRRANWKLPRYSTYDFVLATTSNTL
jgi:hypothetical protein